MSGFTGDFFLIPRNEVSYDPLIPTMHSSIDSLSVHTAAAAGPS